MQEIVNAQMVYDGFKDVNVGGDLEKTCMDIVLDALEKQIPKMAKYYNPLKKESDKRPRGYCPRCKKALRDVEAYCHNCGQSISYPEIINLYK